MPQVKRLETFTRIIQQPAAKSTYFGGVTVKITSRFGASFAATIITGFIFSAPVQAATIDAVNGNVNTGGNAIQVSNVEELYAAVNDSQNAGRRVVLSAGVYALSPLDGNGQPWPNGGRLEFQEDMSLIGVKGDRSAVVIDAINLPAASFPAGPVPLGAIRLGRGRNAVEWLTVRDVRTGHANIVTGLTYSGTPHVRIAHVASSGSGYGISIFNFGPAFSGKTIEVDIVDCDLFEGAIALRGGFRIGNFAGANGSVVNARLIGNRVFGNQYSFFINNGGINSTMNVVSVGNRYFDNTAGLLIVGGINGAANNTINYFGSFDRFEDNTRTITGLEDRGGLYVIGGDRIVMLPAGTTSNTVNATLFANRFSGNSYADLIAFGGRSIQPQFISTVTDNRANLRLIGMPRRPDVVEVFADSVPDDPSTGNSVTVCRGIFGRRCS